LHCQRGALASEVVLSFFCPAPAFLHVKPTADIVESKRSTLWLTLANVVWKPQPDHFGRGQPTAEAPFASFAMLDDPNPPGERRVLTRGSRSACFKRVVQASPIAGDGVDFYLPRSCAAFFFDEFGQLKRSGHADHVGALPSAKTCSATRMLTWLPVMTGMFKPQLAVPVRAFRHPGESAAARTSQSLVHADSCQPMPLLMSVAPAFRSPGQFHHFPVPTAAAGNQGQRSTGGKLR
jgi:hypothetical protein